MPIIITGCKVMVRMSSRFLVSKISWLLLLALTAGVLACLGGCGVRQLTRGELEPPRVKFQSLTLGLPMHQGLPLECTLLVENPNPQDLRVLGYDYEFSLEGQKVVRGESQEAVTLPARGQTVVTMPMLLRLRALPRLLPAILREEKLNYQIAGGVRLGSLLGGFRVPFRAQGRMTPKEGLDELRFFMK